MARAGAGHADLTRAQGFQAINGQPVVEVQRVTLDAGRSLVQTWTELEPIVKQLIGQVSDYVVAGGISGPDAAKVLSLCASVVQKVGMAATNVLRASEGQAKLAILLDAGKVQRRTPTEMTEKQLAAVVLETAKKIVDRTGRCPLCTPVEATPLP